MKNLSDFIYRRGIDIWLAAVLGIALLLSAQQADAQQVWTTTDGNGNVTGFFQNAAPSPVPPNCCTVMSFTDPRMQAYLNPAPTAAQAYAAAINAGLAVTSTSTPALNATYSVTATAQANFAGIAASIAANQGLPNGSTTIAWLDASGVAHSFTAAQFLTLADAARNYVYTLNITLATLQSGGTATWPAATATIP